MSRFGFCVSRPRGSAGAAAGGAGNGDGAADVAGVASSETLDRADDRADPNPHPEVGITDPDITAASNVFGSGSVASALHSRTRSAIVSGNRRGEKLATANVASAPAPVFRRAFGLTSRTSLASNCSFTPHVFEKNMSLCLPLFFAWRYRPEAGCATPKKPASDRSLENAKRVGWCASAGLVRAASDTASSPVSSESSSTIEPSSSVTAWYARPVSTSTSVTSVGSRGSPSSANGPEPDVDASANPPPAPSRRRATCARRAAVWLESDIPDVACRSVNARARSSRRYAPPRREGHPTRPSNHLLPTWHAQSPLKFRTGDSLTRRRCVDPRPLRAPPARASRRPATPNALRRRLYR